MRKLLTSIIIIAAIVALSPISTWACTSMLVSAKASATGRPLMWKHRDTGTEDNFVERVEAINGKIGYVALFDGGDTKLRQAWMGMNDAGFAVMNTASYNVQPDTARYKDMEGYVMSLALQSCRTVGDFEQMLRSLKQPLGVQANFGVMDANGGLAYFEVNDHAYRRINVADTEDGFMIRTNFSVSGTKNEGYGYIRYNNVREALKDEIASKKFSPEAFTEKASRSFYHSLLKKDFADGSEEWVIDQDFIPRYISSASVVIEGVNPGQPVNQMLMWTMIGYPPCSFVMPVTLRTVPADLRPTAPGFKSPLCNKVKDLKHSAFPIPNGDGKHYINMRLLIPIMEKMHQNSMSVYESVRNPQTAAQPTESNQKTEKKK